jgi:hypothetical protein
MCFNYQHQHFFESNADLQCCCAPVHVCRTLYQTFLVKVLTRKTVAHLCAHARVSCSGSGDVDTTSIAKTNSAKESSSTSSGTTNDATDTASPVTDAAVTDVAVTDAAVTEPTLSGLTVTGLTGRTLQLNPAWENASGEWRLGIKRAYELYPKELRSRVQAKRAEAFDEVYSIICYIVYYQ